MYSRILPYIPIHSHVSPWLAHPSLQAAALPPQGPKPVNVDQTKPLGNIQVSQGTYWWKIGEEFIIKSSRDRKRLPWEHLIGCQVCQVVLTKWLLSKMDLNVNLCYWVLSQLLFLSFVIIWDWNFWESTEKVLRKYWKRTEKKLCCDTLQKLILWHNTKTQQWKKS